MKRIALFFALIFPVALVPPAAAATPHYFATTTAGFVPPAQNTLAVKQYLDVPAALAYDAKGNLYYATSTQVWRLNADGTDTPIAGAPGSTLTPSTTNKATQAALGTIRAIALDAQQNLDIDAGNYIYKVTPQGIISVLAGTGGGGTPLLAPPTGPKIPATSVPFTSIAMTVDPAGNVYVYDSVSLAVLSFPPDGLSSGVVGQQLTSNVSALAFLGTTLYAQSGSQLLTSTPPGIFTQLLPSTGTGLAVGIDGLVYTSNGSTVQSVDPSKTTAAPLKVAGTGASGSAGDGGKATAAVFENPTILASNPVDRSLAIFDSGAHVVRLVDAVTGLVQTVAGVSLFGGDNVPAMLALFNQPQGVALDASGNLWIADVQNRRVRRKVVPSGLVGTVMGTGISGGACDGKASQVSIRPTGPLTLDKAGNLYFLNLASPTTTTICKMDTGGTVTTIVGGGTTPIADGSQGTAVSITPASLAVDAAGNVYFDSGFQIFKLGSKGVITLLAGNGTKDVASEGTAAVASPLGTISSVALDSAGLVYFADRDNNRVWKIDSQGLLVLVAGAGGSTVVPAQRVTSGPAKTTPIGKPASLVIDAAGNVYFYTETGFAQVVMVDSSGTLTPIAGGNSVAKRASTGDGGDALNAGFNTVNAMAMDSAGSIYVADGNSYVRKLASFDPNQPPPFVAAGGVVGAGGSFPAVQAVSAGGQVTVYGANFIAAGTHHDLQSSDLVNGKIPTTMAGVCVNFSNGPAAMLNVYPNQINLQVGTMPLVGATVQVTVNCGTPNAVTSNIGGVAVQLASPEFYSFLPDPVAGHNPVAAITLPTGTYVGAPGLLPGATFVPVKAGDLVEAYGTGWGSTAAGFGLGVIPGFASKLTTPFSLTLGGTPVPQGNVVYAGISPCCAGFYQVDFSVPAGTPSGDQALVLTVAGQASPPGAFITVK